MDAQVIHNRLAELAVEKQNKKLEQQRWDRLRILNYNFGRNTEKVGWAMVHNAKEIAKELGLTVDPQLSYAAGEFYEFFRYNDWNQLSPEDIKMAGEVIAAMLAPVIKYDSGSFSFYYAGEESASECFGKLYAAWKALPLWKRILETFNHGRPSMEWPQYISKDKAL